MSLVKVRGGRTNKKIPVDFQNVKLEFQYIKILLVILPSNHKIMSLKLDKGNQITHN
jgi:hypothetical protein